MLGFLHLEMFRRHQNSRWSPRLMIPRSPSLQRIKELNWALVWLFGVVALANPVHTAIPDVVQTTSPVRPHCLVAIAVDQSLSMSVPDGARGATRLDEAQQLLEALLPSLGGNMVALYGFSSDTSLLAPPTWDLLFVRMRIQTLSKASEEAAGTSFENLFRTLGSSLEHQEHIPIVLLLISDGESMPNASPSPQHLINSIPPTVRSRLTVVTVGVGSVRGGIVPGAVLHGKPAHSALNPAFLQELATVQRGHYFPYKPTLSNTLSTIIDQQAQKGTAAAQRESATFGALQTSAYQIPLALALLFYLLNFVLPATTRSR